jgi:hypothetical protein
MRENFGLRLGDLWELFFERTGDPRVERSAWTAQ